MSCNFRKLPKEKRYDSVDIMDHENEAQDDDNEVDFVAKECVNAKLVFNVIKLDDWKPNRRINCEELRNAELPKTMIIWGKFKRSHTKGREVNRWNEACEKGFHQKFTGYGNQKAIQINCEEYVEVRHNQNLLLYFQRSIQSNNVPRQWKRELISMRYWVECIDEQKLCCKPQKLY